MSIESIGYILKKKRKLQQEEEDKAGPGNFVFSASSSIDNDDNNNNNKSTRPEKETEKPKKRKLSKQEKTDDTDTMVVVNDEKNPTKSRSYLQQLRDIYFSHYLNTLRKRYEWLFKTSIQQIYQNKFITAHDINPAAFVTVDPAGIEYVTNLFYENSLIRLIFNIVHSDILSGGVLLEKSGYEMDSNASRFYSSNLSSFIKDCIMANWCYGFIPVVIVPHEQFIGIPRVLDMSQMTVKISTDVYGRRIYAFYKKYSPSISQSSYEDELIPNVMVFEHDPPSPMGLLRSRMTSLYEDLTYYKSLLRCNLRAHEITSNPPLVLESTLRQDGVEISQPIGLGEMSAYDGGFELDTGETAGDPELPSFVPAGVDPSLVGGDVITRSGRRSGLSRRRRAAASSSQSRLAKMVAYYINHPSEAAAAGGSAHVIQSDDPSVGNIRVPVMKLEMDRKVANNHLPVVNDSALTDFRQFAEERIATLFGVPRSMFAQNSNYRVSGNENSRSVFNDSQRMVKEWLISTCDYVMNKIFAPILVRQALYETLPLINNETDSNSITVKTILPSLPPMPVVNALYREGTLKYKGYKKIVSASFNIPNNYLEEKPRIDIRELTLNGNGTENEFEKQTKNPTGSS